MAEEVCSVEYVYLLVKDRPGEGLQVLEGLKHAGVNLLAFTGFPVRGGKAQMDLVTQDLPGVKRVAKAFKWKLSPVKKAFLVWGDDRLGAVAEIVARLSEAKINITALDAVSAGMGRYGMILWVPPRSYQKAAKVLGVK